MHSKRTPESKVRLSRVCLFLFLLVAGLCPHTSQAKSPIEAPSKAKFATAACAYVRSAARFIPSAREDVILSQIDLDHIAWQAVGVVNRQAHLCQPGEPNSVGFLLYVTFLSDNTDTEHTWSAVASCGALDIVSEYPYFIEQYLSFKSMNWPNPNSVYVVLRDKDYDKALSSAATTCITSLWRNQ